jgi:hypothetical protein
MYYYLTLYALYLPITVALTIWVARTLFTHGRPFLVELFHGDETLADSVNRLLLTGFYLINVGYATLTLRTTEPILNTQQMVEGLSVKLGTIILILGAMHFFNLYVLYRLRHSHKQAAA